MRGQQWLVRRGGILAAAIRVVEGPCRGFPVRARLRAGLFSQINGQPMAHRPANHGARVAVEHHDEVEPTLRGSNVDEVPGPHQV